MFGNTSTSPRSASVGDVLVDGELQRRSSEEYSISQLQRDKGKQQQKSTKWCVLLRTPAARNLELTERKQERTSDQQNIAKNRAASCGYRELQHAWKLVEPVPRPLSITHESLWSINRSILYFDKNKRYCKAKAPRLSSRAVRISQGPPSITTSLDISTRASVPFSLPSLSSFCL